MLLYIMFFHWICDFLLQSRWMAENKSKNIIALMTHVLTYSGAMFLLCALIHGLQLAFVFSFVNGALHFLTDFGTSKLTTHFREQENNYLFFGTIGLDQYIHFVCLWMTANYMLA